MHLVCHLALGLWRELDAGNQAKLLSRSIASNSIADDQHLETGVLGFHFKRVDAVFGRPAKLRYLEDGDEVDLAGGGVDGERARLLACGQRLDNVVAVGGVAAGDGEAALRAAVGSEEEAAD